MSRLKGAIAEKSLTLGTFAKMMGINYTTLWHKITGQSEFTESEIKKACDILEKDPKEIFFQKSQEIEDLRRTFDEVVDIDQMDAVLERLAKAESELKELIRGAKAKDTGEDRGNQTS